MKAPEYDNPIYREAVTEQRRLRRQIVVQPLPAAPRFVGGADVSYHLHGRTFWGGFVVCEPGAGFRVVDSAVVRMEVDFPYIPGLLGFRETPVLAAAFEKLRIRPEVTFVDAHGTAHPRGFGSACHVGVVLDIPTVGCAKSLLCGEVGELEEKRGSRRPILLEGEPVGVALRTREGVQPVYVSVGHRSDTDTAVSLVLACAPRYRIPEPVRLAHAFVNEARRRGFGG
jgi:deoxyribonuclease V